MENFKRKYSWIPDVPDQRDKYFKIARSVLKLPANIDLSGYGPKIEDQGPLGSCTANALTAAMEFLLGKNAKAPYHLSRLFLYYNERVLEGSVNQDAGAMIRDGIKTMAKDGVCTEKTWPYLVGKFKTKPPASAYAEAKNHQILNYYRLLHLPDIRTCLADGFPVVFGFSVYESFESGQVAKTGTVPMPKKRERLLGGHAVMAVGYNDATKRLLVRNSWGPKWGKNGYFTLPYRFIENQDLSDDFWTIRTEEG
jgi:C1A family cysteine protease